MSGIAVIGAGAWGTALAQAWASSGMTSSNATPSRMATTLFARDEFAATDARRTRSVPRLPGVTLDPSLIIDHDPARLGDADIVAIVVPAQTMGTALERIAPYLASNAMLVLCSKGIEATSGRTMAEVAGGLLPGRTISVLSGPSFAADVARGKPTAVTLAANDRNVAMDLAGRLSTPAFRIYASDDVAGVEAGGALKNVLALAVGAARGLDLGASAEAALTTRGFAEITRLAAALGGRTETLMGLSGLGDTMLTCASPQSRNFAYGMALTHGSVGDLPLAEGVATSHAARTLAQEHGIEVPVIEAVCAVLDGTMTPRQAVGALLSRPLKQEA